MTRAQLISYKSAFKFGVQSSDIAQVRTLHIEKFIQDISHDIVVLHQQLSVESPVSKPHSNKLLHGRGGFLWPIPMLVKKVCDIRIVAILAHILRDHEKEGESHNYTAILQLVLPLPTPDVNE